MEDLTAKLVEDVSYFSVVTGRTVGAVARNEAGDLAMVWEFNSVEPSFLRLLVRDGVRRVVLDPATEEEWALAHRIIGYCAYNGIEWEAP